MVQLTYILFIAIAVPLGLMLFLLESRSRMVVSFMLIGMLTCLVAGEINTLIYNGLHCSMLYATVTVTPIVEEVLKGLPVVYCALFITDNRERLISMAVAGGIGFAIYENVGIIIDAGGSISIGVALIRGFATALTHGVCTSLIGVGLSMVNKRKKLAITGTFGLFTAAVTYHAIFNALMQSEYMDVACILPILTYIPLVILYMYSKRNETKTKARKKQN